MKSYYTEFLNAKMELFTNCFTERGFRLHVVILDSFSNSDKRIFSNWDRCDKGRSHYPERASAGF